MLPGRIEELEARVAEMTEAMAQPAFFQQARDAITAHQTALADTQAELEGCYQRWEELESML